MAGVRMFVVYSSLGLVCTHAFNEQKYKKSEIEYEQITQEISQVAREGTN
ncbi:MAG: hypothetical protein HY707_09555 [Ignavibacteriae bacterium]|nr:hypothetical protein [Ignavibacteriota bacterium]